MAKATVMAVVNQKGGTGKTTTCENLGVGLAMEGKKVLLVDTDPQASLTICLGHPVPDQLSPTLSDMMGKILSEQPIPMFGVVLPLLPVLIVLDSSAGSSITAAMDGVSADKLRTGLKTSVILFRLLKQNQEI